MQLLWVAAPATEQFFATFPTMTSDTMDLRATFMTALQLKASGSPVVNLPRLSKLLLILPYEAQSIVLNLPSPSPGIG